MFFERKTVFFDRKTLLTGIYHLSGLLFERQILASQIRFGGTRNSETSPNSHTRI